MEKQFEYYTLLNSFLSGYISNFLYWKSVSNNSLYVFITPVYTFLHSHQVVRYTTYIIVDIIYKLLLDCIQLQLAIILHFSAAWEHCKYKFHHCFPSTLVFKFLIRVPYVLLTLFIFLKFILNLGLRLISHNCISIVLRIYIVFLHSVCT